MPSSPPVNEFNTAIKTSGVWDTWMRANGVDTTPGRPIKLSDAQRKSFQRYLESQGAQFPSGVEIDASGNMNENEGFAKQAKKWGPIAAGIAVSLFGIPGTPIAGLLSGGSSAAAGAAGVSGGATGATGAGAAAGATGAAGGLGATALRYGLQYGVPLVGSLVTGKMASNAERDSNAALMGYYNRALDAEKEERDYRRTFDEDERRYSREFGEEGRRYGRYSDQYGRESDEDILKYGRARDDYGRLSDEEKLAYDRAQSIRDKNYGYQQYGNFVETLEPFRAGGSAAASRMSQLMGGPATPDTGSYLNLARTARNSVQAVPNVPNRPTWDFVPNRPTWNYPGAAPPNTEGPGGSGPPTSSGQPVGGGPSLVWIEAPDGERRQMPPALADAYIALGAKRLG